MMIRSAQWSYKTSSLALMQVYLFILGVAIILAYVVSRFITKSLEEISDKITQTALGTSNQKIDLQPPRKRTLQTDKCLQ